MVKKTQIMLYAHKNILYVACTQKYVSQKYI